MSMGVPKNKKKIKMIVNTVLGNTLLSLLSFFQACFIFYPSGPTTYLFFIFLFHRTIQIESILYPWNFGYVTKWLIVFFWNISKPKNICFLLHKNFSYLCVLLHKSRYLKSLSKAQLISRILYPMWILFWTYSKLSRILYG